MTEYKTIGKVDFVKIDTLEELDIWVKEIGWLNICEFFDQNKCIFEDFQGKWFTYPNRLVLEDDIYDDKYDEHKHIWRAMA